ncbi:uncharacterized protein BYT42DRAFT_571986 [Radiomyces spectabilis]|uniref:uncharacterized protein n=1 Tax=Radiomyces spectabilis TaxID=64574 RepID=UPI00221F1887|nr:uncharacterized protein BYT42DRAFT_571986 [Radiomyces spectabilis]KAI8377864.1 hypothetical protein BYT42DRAFT_571986 [Radiomyces spectabilis]
MPSAGAPQSICDLTTRIQATTGDVPPLLIGATVTVVDNNVYVFGGRLQSSRQISNQLYVLSLDTHVWKSVSPKGLPPQARYFHSANHHDNHIYFHGGMTNSQSAAAGLIALNDTVLLNLYEMAWEYPVDETHPLPQPRYAHLSTISDGKLVIIGGQDIDNNYIPQMNVYDRKRRSWYPAIDIQAQVGAYRAAAAAITPLAPTPATSAALADMHLASIGIDDDNDVLPLSPIIHVYSNFNFDDVTRRLYTMTVDNRGQLADVSDMSHLLVGSSLPPPLRFPTASVCGQHFMISGPCLVANHHQFHIWAFNLATMAWTRLDAGPLLTKGSWLRGAFCEAQNKFLVFGHPERSMQEDYTHRLVSFEHIVSVDTEAFGVYRPPPVSCDSAAEGLGLAILNDPVLSDLTIVTTDNQTMAVNSSILAQRWPSIRSTLQPLLSPQSHQAAIGTLRKLTFPDTYSVLVAFLQFIYTNHLLTVQQHQPYILSRLLLLSDLFGISRLKELAIHALHQMLNMSTASMIYETASLSNCVSLQIRALRVMINAKKIMQRKQQQQQQQQQQQHYFQQHHHQEDGETQSIAPAYQPLSQLLQQYDLNAPTPMTPTQELFVGKSAHGSGARPTASSSSPVHMRVESQRLVSESTKSNFLSRIHSTTAPSTPTTAGSPQPSALNFFMRTPGSSKTPAEPAKSSRSGTFWLSGHSKKKTIPPSGPHKSPEHAARPKWPLGEGHRSPTYLMNEHT